MARVVTLGTAAAVPDETHATTHLAVEGEFGFFMIDSGCNPILRIRDAGLDLDRLGGLILTHFHPDHVATVPIFLMDTWLLGRRAPLPIYGLQDVVDRYNIMMDLFRRDEWPGFFDTPCRVVPEKTGALVFEDDDFRVTAAPVKHVVPNIGLRIENKDSGGVVAYSSDTSPCDTMVELARNADILIHEAAESTPGHSSAAQAGEVAHRAGARRLVLIHYRPAPHKYDRWIEEAAETFGGPVELGQDLATYEF
ncbi:MAG: MBL fold metallo-hydrolase [Anaerolineae bacterium]|nr:MBL fold metallo-hydrolase [Anaerolineae bacterium]